MYLIPVVCNKLGDLEVACFQAKGQDCGLDKSLLQTLTRPRKIYKGKLASTRGTLISKIWAIKHDRFATVRLCPAEIHKRESEQYLFCITVFEKQNI